MTGVSKNVETWEGGGTQSRRKWGLGRGVSKKKDEKGLMGWKGITPSPCSLFFFTRTQFCFLHMRLEINGCYAG